MGYYYHFDQAKVFLPAESMPAVEEALRAYNARLTAAGYRPSIDEKSDQPVLVQVLKANRWDVGFDESGNLVRLFFDDIKGHDGCDPMDAIAPWMRPGSWIQIHDDDGRTYRYLFDGGPEARRISPSWEGCVE